MKICFVCMGNICRSPTAEGIMRAKVDALSPGSGTRSRSGSGSRAGSGSGSGSARAIELDSAGTGGWHRGEPADERARAEARRRGIELTSRARQVHAGDFVYFDLLLAMDRANHADLLDLAPDPDAAAKVRLLLEFVPGNEGRDLDDPRLDVPDPYYGGPHGFIDVFDLVDAACDGLLAHVLDQLVDQLAEPLPPATPGVPPEGREPSGA